MVVVFENGETLESDANMVSEVRKQAAKLGVTDEAEIQERFEQQLEILSQIKNQSSLTLVKNGKTHYINPDKVLYIKFQTEPA